MRDHNMSPSTIKLLAFGKVLWYKKYLLSIGHLGSPIDHLKYKSSTYEKYEWTFR